MRPVADSAERLVLEVEDRRLPSNGRRLIVSDFSRIATVALAAALAWFALLAVLLARFKYFSIDEFQYAHAAWLVARGEVPYRDFFEVHFPLVYQALAPVFLLAGDEPQAVLGLRLGMLGFLILACAAAAGANRRRGPVAALAAPLLMLALPPFVTLATEIRPDAAAVALFLGSLAALQLRAGDVLCGFTSGLLSVGAVWGSQKAAVCGTIYAAALLIDVVRGRRGSVDDGRRLLRNPVAFVAGALSGVATVALYLGATQSSTSWWAWAIAWAAEHERHYPGFSWRRYLSPVLVGAPWFFALGAIGWATTVRALTARGRAALGDVDLLLVGALATTFASFALQRAPYPYSLLPFLGVVAVFAARATGLLLASATVRPLRVAAAGSLAFLLTWQSIMLVDALGETNVRQLEVLARIDQLTTPADAIYDNAGAYVARPHAHWYFYTDAYIRRAFAETLANEIPDAILATGAVLSLRSLRSKTLPASLKEFLKRHFQPLDGDLALWGQRYTIGPGGRLEDSFLAVRDDRYFVRPLSALARGTLAIDGTPVVGPIVTLTKGEHRIAYVGPLEELEILWLPRDGRPWRPQRGLRATFARLL